MRLLHVTDTHLGLKRLVHRPGDRGPRSDLLQTDAFDALRRALNPALRQEVDLVVHTGDVFDRSRPPRAEVVRTCELLGEVAKRVPVVVMPGNHDRRGLSRWLPHGAKDLHVVDRPSRLVVRGLAMAVVPFERTATGFAVAAKLATGPGVDVLLAHQAFDGHRVPGHMFRTSDRTDTIGEAHLPRGVRWVLCGHLHPRQVVKVGQATVVCPGSTVRTSLSERDQVKATARWDLGDPIPWRMVDLPGRPMHRVTCEADLEPVARGDLVCIKGSADLARRALSLGAWLFGSSLRGTGPRAAGGDAPDRDEQLALPLL